MREAIDIEVQMLQVAADMADLQHMKRSARDGSGGEARPIGPTKGSREQPDREPNEARRRGAPKDAPEKAKKLIQEAKRLLDAQPDYQAAWKKLNEALGLLR